MSKGKKADDLLVALANKPPTEAPEHRVPLSDDELFRADIEKAKEPWLTYYFAVTPFYLRKYFRDTRDDVLISFAYFIDRKGNVSDKRIPWEELKATKKSGRRVMLDSGAFTNFNAPGHCKFEQYVEFLSSPEVKEIFDEYVMFDDLRSRETTLKNYVKMLEGGFDPLFVDHLWHDDDEPSLAIWKSRPKLCVSGFAKTLPTQEKFPGDPKGRLSDVINRGRDVDTKCHFLAASSIRKFLKYADRLDSVDSTAWIKSAAFGMYIATEWKEINGVELPIQKVYDRPDTHRKGPRYPSRKEARRVAQRVREIKREFGCNTRQAYIRHSIEETRKYVSALNSIDPKTILSAYEKTAKAKSWDFSERGNGFVFLDSHFDERDWTEKSQIVDERPPVVDEVEKLSPKSYDPRTRSDEEIRNDWGVIVKLWAGYKQEGRTTYSPDEMIALATVIAKDLSRRGSGVLVFNTSEMSPPERELFGAVSRLFKFSPDMVSKEIVTPATDFGQMGPEQLLEAHKDLHRIGVRVAASRREADWTWDELVDAHGRIVEALDAKGYAHPEARGVLDAASSSFQKVDSQRLIGKSSGPLLGEIEKALEEALGIIEAIDPNVVKKSKAPSGASRPQEGVAVEKMIIATGIPGEWSPMAAAALGASWRRRCRTFWNKSTASTRRFLRNAHDEFVEKAEGGAINSGSAAKKNPARYVSHIHYRGNRADLVIRFEKARGSLETWRIKLPILDVPVTSLAKARELFREGLAPLPVVGEVRAIKQSQDTPKGWLECEGVTPPGAYGSGAKVPGVFHIVETGTFSASEGTNVRVIKFVPDSGEEPRLLTLRKLPVSEAHIGDSAVRKVLDEHFEAPTLPDMIRKLSLEDGGPGTWVSRFIVEQAKPGSRSDDRNQRQPAKPGERRSGSDRNAPGSATADGSGDIKLSEATMTALERKVEEHNEKHGDKKGKRVNTRTLAAVYRRGAGAFSTSHRPGMTRAQWAMARVNHFLRLVASGKPADPKYITDNDLLPKDHPRSTKKEAEVEEFEKDVYDGINFTPPAGVREELRRGLKWHKEGHSGDGLVPATVTWATRLANGEDISPEKARKMRAWLARHETDKSGEGFNPGEKGFPSPGRVAWALWGGDPAVGWSNKLVEQMEARERKKSGDELDHMPDGISKILKAEKRLIVGIVLQPEIVDAQNDIIGEEEIEQAAHAFLAKYNRETSMGLMHKVFGDVGVDLVESYVTPAPMEIGGKKVRKGTWIMTVKVKDEELWDMVKSGKITGFSIGGLACSKET